jgi:hypothetical protein
LLVVEERDRNLISGLFLEDNIAHDKFWMCKYFKSEIQKRFLIYFLIFGSHYYFNRHSGIPCTKRYLKKMKKKFTVLENLHKQAKENFDLETLSKIEMGKYKLMLG